MYAPQVSDDMTFNIFWIRNGNKKQNQRIKYSLRMTFWPFEFTFQFHQRFNYKSTTHQNINDFLQKNETTFILPFNTYTYFVISKRFMFQVGMFHM